MQIAGRTALSDRHIVRREIAGRQVPIIDLGQGPALVFVPAAEFVWGVYRHQLVEFARDWRVVLYGRHESKHGPLDPAVWVDEIESLLNSLEIERAVLCGWSNAAMVALQLALSHPHRVQALILAAGAARFPMSPLRRLAWHLAPAVSDAFALQYLGRKMGEGEPRVLVQEYLRWLGDVESLKPKLLNGLVPMLLALDLRPRLVEITAPTLVVVGERDKFFGVPASRELQEGIPGARLAVVPGAAHLAPLSQPRSFNALVRAFLCESVPRSGFKVPR